MLGCRVYRHDELCLMSVRGSRLRMMGPFQPFFEHCMLFSRASLQAEWPQTTR